MDKGFFITQMYGLTETCGDGAYNTSQEEKYLSSVGKMDQNPPLLLEGWGAVHPGTAGDAGLL